MVNAVIDDLRVCFVGDSLVAGVGDPLGLGWPGRLVARAYAQGQPVTAYNLGVRRQTSLDILSRWQGECGQRLRDADDLRVVFSFGVNDTTVEDGAVRVDQGMTELNLQVMLDQALTGGWSALVVGMPPIADAAHDRRVAQLDLRLAAVCAQAGVGHIAVHWELSGDTAWTREIRAGDGAHPAAGGYDELAALVAPHWDTWLRIPARDSANPVA
jgi:lysophospholipase L1-like esterase